MALITDDPSRISIGLGLKAYRDMFLLRGRSTRTELVSSWLISLLVVIAARTLLSPLDLSISLTHAFDTQLPRTLLLILLESVPFLPVFALIARRAQDIGFLGWPVTLIAIGTYALGIWRDMHFRTTGVDLPPDWAEYARLAGCLVFYGVLLCPPSRGANRFGPDPRLDGELTVAPIPA